MGRKTAVCGMEIETAENDVSKKEKEKKMAYDNEFRIIANLSTLINGRHTTQLMRVRVVFLFFDHVFHNVVWKYGKSAKAYR